MERIYNVLVNPEDDLGLSMISIVDNPAIQADLICMNKVEDIKMSVDKNRNTIFGPVLIPNQKILRLDKNNNPYYIVFSKESIEMLQYKYFKSLQINNVNLMHDQNLIVEDVSMISSFVSNKELGINPKQYSDLPDGTWFVSFKVNNLDVLEKIQSGEYKGFSIEAHLEMEQVMMSKILSEEEQLLDDILELIEKNITRGN
jgi:hypothetical protein